MQDSLQRYTRHLICSRSICIRSLSSVTLSSRSAIESIYIKRDHFGTKKKTIFKAPPSPFQYLGRAWGESKGPIGTFQDLYVAPKGAFECLFGGLELIKCAIYL